MSVTGNYLDLIDHCQMNIVMLYLVIVFYSGNPFQKMDTDETLFGAKKILLESHPQKVYCCLINKQNYVFNLSLRSISLSFNELEEKMF